MKKKKVILVLGRSASGKTHISREACKRLGLKQIKSYTTRPMREDDYKESDHIFLTDDEFDEILKTQEIAAYTEIKNDETGKLYRYCTTKNILRENDVYVIDPKGYYDIIKNCGDEFEFILIYVRVSPKIGEERALQRGDKLANYKARYESENKQFSDFEKEMIWHYHLLNNYDIERAIETMMKFIRKELNM